MENLISEIIKSINDKKEAYLIEACKKLNLPIPEFSILEQRFNPYLKEDHQGFGELYYYNDGTKNGKFIIGFTEFKEPDYFSDNPITLNWDVITEEPEWNKKK